MSLAVAGQPANSHSSIIIVASLVVVAVVEDGKAQDKANNAKQDPEGNANY